MRNFTLTKRKITQTLFIIVLLSSFFIAIPQNSQAAQKSLMDYVSFSCRERGDCNFNDFFAILNGSYEIIFGIVGSVALLFFIYGGVMFLISEGNQEKVGRAKKIVISSVIGLAIIFSSFLIVDYLLKKLEVTNDQGNIQTIEGSKPWNTSQ